MGCGNCGTAGADGKPAGCQSNGNCSTGSCNKMNVFNWLSDIPLSDFGKPFPIVEVSFHQGSKKEFFVNSKDLLIEKGSMVSVEGVNGYDVGIVSLTGELVKYQLKKYGVKEKDVEKKILRPSTENDIEAFSNQEKRNNEVLVKSRAIARQLNLDMKIGNVEIQADGKKIAINYTASHRVDFRELLKAYASEFNARIEMRQIGARQESGKVGGIGSCGRELCCSTWLTDFKTVLTSAARYQNLSINQTKLSGQCGKLKCCLNYELDTYMDALKDFPDNAEVLEVKSGKVKLIKKDIFKRLMWYSFDDRSKHYPLSIETVIDILEENKIGKYPDELKAEELEKSVDQENKVIRNADFVNDVGQITLQSLTKKRNKTKNNQHKYKNSDRKNDKKPVALKDKSKSQNTPPKQRTDRNNSKNHKPKSPSEKR